MIEPKRNPKLFQQELPIPENFPEATMVLNLKKPLNYLRSQIFMLAFTEHKYLFFINISICFLESFKIIFNLLKIGNFKA